MLPGNTAKPLPFDELALAFDLEERGQTAEAEQLYLRVVDKQPKEWRALHQLGAICMARGDYADALRFMGAAMKAKPSAAEAKSNYGLILQKLNRHQEALTYFKRALDARPGYAAALLNRGTSLFALNRPSEALAAFDRVLAVEPQNAKALYNRANMLHELRRYDESLAAMSKALAVSPDDADARWNAALTRLTIGDFERGWQEYEARWQTQGHQALKRDFTQPLWLGEESVTGKTLLVHAEQGFGDTLQFIRYLPTLAAQGAKIVLEVQPALLPLLAKADGASQVIARGDALPPFDLHCPIMSVPLACKTTLATIPATVPYLAPPSDRIHQWRERLPATGKRRVALSWAGSATNKHDRLRTITLEKLQALFEIDSVEWVSVQRELRAGDGDFLAAHPQIHHVGSELNDFADTAAVLSAGDLVITVDTAVAHLAGAMGKPVWILLQYSPDFRWLTEREDSPWYPSARLFRQSEFGEWDGVIASVTEALRAEA